MRMIKHAPRISLHWPVCRSDEAAARVLQLSKWCIDQVVLAVYTSATTA